MPLALSVESTVGQLVAERPARARVFEDLGLDYCCGGKKTVAQACAQNGLDPAGVLARLGALDGQPAPAEAVWAEAGLADLCDHIVATHHAYLRSELPRLTGLLAKVVRAHGAARPALARTAEVFLVFAADLGQHMLKEELVLFPLIRRLEQGPAAATPCGSVCHPIAAMEHEHDQAGDALRQMRELTDGFTPPLDACNTYRVTLASLAELERDMHRHVHKENNILFPRAAELERRRRIGAAG